MPRTVFEPESVKKRMDLSLSNESLKGLMGLHIALVPLPLMRFAAVPAVDGPAPAAVLIMLLASIIRRTLLSFSAMKSILRAWSTSTSVGPFTSAAVLSPPSLVRPPVFPLPAIVVTMPVGSTARMALLPLSATNTVKLLPSLSVLEEAGCEYTASPKGSLKAASVSALPSA
jgi:hypothetical protein